MSHSIIMMHQRNNKSYLQDESYTNDRGKCDGNIHDIEKVKDGLVLTENKGVHVNDAKVGGIIFFPLIGIVMTSCLRDMYQRNSTMHREPNIARALLVDCPVQDPDNVWLLLVCSYLLAVASIAVLCYTMLGLSLKVADTAISPRMRVVICRICLVAFYCGFYNWDICMGTMPYLKKATTQVYFPCIVLFISYDTLSMPVVVKQKSRSSTSKPPRWPLFIIKLMVFILYTDAGWHKHNLGFSNGALRSFLAHHWIWFERPIGAFMINNSMITAVAAYATIVFEDAGWILVCLGYDRVAAAVALNFHIGIYLSMNVDFFTFWCCSYVFFFVPTIISSSAFQRIVMRPVGGKSLSVPLGSLFGESGKGGVHSSDGSSVMKRSSKSQPKMNRKSSVIFGVGCVLAFTYKGFYPYTLMIPATPYSQNPSFIERLYGLVCGMTFKPFNTYDMYTKSGSGFPTSAVSAFVVLKHKPTPNGTEHYRRVKWVPKQRSNYVFLNALDGMFPHDKKYSFASQRTVTRCNIFACLANHLILDESVGEWTKGDLSGWDVDSIELTETIYDLPTGVVSDIFTAETSEFSSLKRYSATFCALHTGSDSPHKKIQDSSNVIRYDAGSCGDILAELDESARSFDDSSGRNPFYILSVSKRTRKHLNHIKNYADAPLWAVIVVMLGAGYKTYLLER